MIYVDQLAYKKANGRKFYCHMFADTLDELHAFADSIGRKRCWFHRSLGGYNHYDLCDKFRTEALKNGALEIETKDAIMARKLSKTIGEYLKADGWSSNLFIQHATYAFEQLKDKRIDIGRSVIYVRSADTMIKAYVHHNGRTAEWVTFTDVHGKELKSVHHTITPEEFVETIKELL